MFSPKDDNPKDYGSSFLTRCNAESIVNSYMMVVTDIFGEISRMTSDIDSWNIEFEDAKNRLTPSKADKLLSIDGAYRASSTRVSIVREVMLYK